MEEKKQSKYAPIAFCVLVVGKKVVVKFDKQQLIIPSVVLPVDYMSKTPQQQSEDLQGKLLSQHKISSTKPQLLGNNLLTWEADLKSQFPDLCKQFPSGINMFMYFAYVRLKDSQIDQEKQSMWVDSARDECDKLPQSPIVTLYRTALAMLKIMINQVQDQKKRDEQQAVKKMQKDIKNPDVSDKKLLAKMKFKDIFQTNVDQLTFG